MKLNNAGDRPLQLLFFKQGIPSKRKLLASVDYVPAFCTHHPLLLPIKWLSEIFGLECLNCVIGLKWLRIV